VILSDVFVVFYCVQHCSKFIVFCLCYIQCDLHIVDSLDLPTDNSEVIQFLPVWIHH